MLSTTFAPGVGAAPTATTLDEVLAGGAVRAVYQPIVELESGRVVAYEALARGPVGTPLERPDALFADARRLRRLSDLDQACQAAAFRGALDGGLTPPWRLFVNVEPDVLDLAHTAALAELVRRARAELSVVVELTERALTSRPAELLRTVGRVRELGWGIALDDVGAERQSLALMPLLRPDVIKLDLRLVQRRPSAEIAEIVTAVNAEADRTGAVVLAEGIETEEHLATARSMGATLGQGWRFGRPGPLPALASAPRPASRLSPVTGDDRGREGTPFEVAASARAVRRGTKPLLIEISKHLERQAGSLGETAVVLATFQHARHFTPSTRRRYAALAGRAAFVGAFGGDMPLEPAPGVRGGVLTEGDPLLREWDIAVIGPHFAAAFCALDLGDEGPDAGRRFDFILTYDRDQAIAVANTLMSRVWADATVVDSSGAVVGGRARALPSGPALRGRTLAERLPDAARTLEQRALDATANGVTIADMRDPDQPLTYVNAAFERLSGYRADEVLGRNCRLLQGPETDPASIAEMARAIHDGRDCWVSLVNYRRDGTPWWNEIHLAPVHDDSGSLTHYIGVQSDVTARVEAQERVRELAFHDSLTGLANRRRTREHLDSALARAHTAGSSVALLFLDLDDFKEVNDRFGHAAGDQLLQHVAGRLRSVARASDLLARQGGDEFLLVLTDLAEDPVAVAERVGWQAVAALSGTFEVGGEQVHVGASVGIAVAGPDDPDPHDLFQTADAAMYRAKAGGGNRVSR